MMSKRLLNVIKGKGLSVQMVVDKMNNKYHIAITKSTFYRKLKDVETFKGYEIEAIALILHLSYQDTGKIFFADLVA